MPELKNLWIGKTFRVSGEEQTIRADFSNDRHYEVVISRPCKSEQVAGALFEMAAMISRDPKLKN